MAVDAGRRQRLRRKMYEALWDPAVMWILARLPFIRRVYNGWARPHPFDVEHGVDTSGSRSAAECAPNAAMAA